MELVFSQPVSNHQFTLRMVAQSDERQTIEQFDINISPECVLHSDEDTYGNRYVYGEIEGTHDRFCVTVSGIANTTGKSVRYARKGELAYYRFPSQYTGVGKNLEDYYNSSAKMAVYEKNRCEASELLESADFAMDDADEKKKLDYCIWLLHRIYSDMEYKQGVTDIHTTAENAISLRSGVCQDYAHVMIALCRMAHIPARYVVGMMMGEGFSHAWVEVCVGGRWYGLDPTNDRIVDDSYVKLSHGRDYKDCIVNRGVFRGNCFQTQNISVVVDYA